MQLEPLPSQIIRRVALRTASYLLGDVGKKIGYWHKPLLGKPEVTGSGYVFGTYDIFIMGCGPAGLWEEASSQGQILLPDAESLVAYYLEAPQMKEVLEAH